MASAPVPSCTDCTEATQADIDAETNRAVAAEATKVSKSTYDANTILKADSDDTPTALTMGTSTILARLAAGGIKAATPAEIKTLLAIAAGDVSGLGTAATHATGDFAQTSNNGSDFASATIARSNLVVPKIGGNTGPITSRLWDNVWRDNAGYLKDVPGTTIAAVVKIYTVPANYMAWVTFGMANTTGGTVNLSVFAMPDGTTPTAVDRVSFTAVSANNSSTASGDMVLDEGATLWAFASAAASINVTPYIMLIPKPLVGGTFTTSLIKAVSFTTDQTLLACSTSGNWAQHVTVGLVHNTTGSTITLTTKIKRAADGAAYPIGIQAIGANAQATFLGGQGPALAVLENGDTIYSVASATGLNLSTFWCERPKVGLP